MAHKFGISTSITEEERQLEHLLHLVWALEEEGDQRIENVRDRWEHATEVEQLIEQAVDQGLASCENGDMRLTDPGRDRTREIVRRYRLAECLLSEVLLLDEAEYEQSACEFEHILTPEVTDSVCSLLGHPPTCPHGRLIPRGECCAKFGSDVQPLVVKISELSPGDVGKIVFISSKRTRRLDRLSTMGIIPGTLLKLHQRKPSFIVDLGETQLAIDQEIAGEIYVKKMGCSYI